MNPTLILCAMSVFSAPPRMPGNRHISLVLAASGEHVREVSQWQAGDGIPIVSRSTGSLAGGSGALPGCHCQQSSRKKHRTLAALDP